MRFLLFTVLFCSTTLFSQNSEDLTEQIIVRLNYKLLDWNVIDNQTVLDGPIKDFLNGEGISLSNGLDQSDFDFKALQATKIFSNLFTKDSISIGRQGNIVNVPPFWATFRVKVPEQIDYGTFLNKISDMYPLVLYAHPLFTIEYDSVANDELYPDQHSLYSDSLTNAHINIQDAWDIETGKRHIKVGVFDTGVDSTHSDIELLTGWGYYSEINNPWGQDEHGHGTPVAGIIGAKRNNVTGISGIAGGNGIDTTGVSLLDFKFGQGGNVQDVDIFSIGIISAARRVGSYYTNWTPNVLTPGIPYSDSMPGYGIHIGNHSYGLRLTSSIKDVLVPPVEDDTISGPGGGGGEFPECYLCKEAFLFSLQNGVVNVVSRGNVIGASDHMYPYQYASFDKEKIPSSYHDSWVISVGASGDDGERLIGGQNTGPYGYYWFSPQGRNIDLIAPGTKALVVSTKSNQQDTSSVEYRKFNGTSASAPHVSGVAALILSKYNKTCYSQLNLDPADVEYILEKSAVDVDSIGYDINSGYGRLDAKAALDMIDFPSLQIVHPHDSLLYSSVILVDTINLHLDNTLYSFMDGPLSSSYPLENAVDYRVVRKKFQNKYYFGDYILPGTTSLLDVWVRHSQTNSLTEFLDTTMVFNMGLPELQFIDTFRLEPIATIVNFTDTTVTLEGYYYHFIDKYALGIENGITDTEDYWYPVNPDSILPKMAYSIYIQDTTLVDRYDFVCDSINDLLDTIVPYLNYQELNLEEDLTLYPNPTSSILHVTIPNTSGEGKLELYDITGKLIKRKELEAGIRNYNFEVFDLENGMYLLNMSVDGMMLISKKWIRK